MSRTIEETCDMIVYTLKRIREKKDISSAGLAELTNIKQPNITRMETFNVSPNLKTVVNIAYALGYKLQLVPKDSPDTELEVEIANELKG